MATQTSVSRKKRSQTMQIAALIGAVICALFARPVIKPWLAGHRTEIAPITFISFIPWVLFSLYWEIEAKNSAPALSSESKTSRMVHVVLSNLALALIVLPIAGLQQRFEPNALPVKLAGLAAECAGLARISHGQ